MSYNGFNPVMDEEEEVLSVQGSDISVHRYLASHTQQVSANGYNNTTMSSSCDAVLSYPKQDRGPSPSSSFRRPRPLAPLNPLSLINSFNATSISETLETTCSTNSQPPSTSASDSSPFLRRLDSFRRSSAEFSINSLRQSYGNVPTSGSGTDFDGDPMVGADSNLDHPAAVRSSSSSESQALYGNEDVVKDLKPDYARWFYKYEQDRVWTPFTGYDSIRMETRYRNLVVEREAYGQNVHNGSEGYYSGESSSGYYFNHATNEYGDHYDYQYYANGYHDNPYPHHHHQESVNVAPASSLHNNLGCYNQEHQYVGESATYHDSNYYTAPQPQQHHHNPQQLVSDSHFIPDSSSTRYESSGSTNSKDKDESCGENVIIVRGGLYEADLETWTCVATYWPGDKCQVIRGTWFYDGTWQPLSVEHSERLEEEHLGQFSGISLSLYAQTNGPSQPDSPTKKNKPVVHRVSFCEFHVDWTSPSEIHLFSKAASYKFMRSVGQRLGFQTWGHRLCRGYYKPASIEDRPSEIGHMVFVIHGIGQKMDTGRIVRNCATFRETVSSLKEKFFPHLNEAKQRAEFFPVEWRSAAKLDGDVVDAITPHKLLSLRQLLNATAMDIMYYTSPLYRTEIQNALRNELNRIYSNFVKRNPDFKERGGKVSVIAHSLGAVITYDIVTGYMAQSLSPEMPKSTLNEGPEINGFANNDQLTGLLFELEHFFCLGSPLSVFLALRWREPYNPSYRSFILPKLLCKRIYNVFYSTDPVAYRLEPLFHKFYVHIAPLPVYSYGTLLGRPKYDEMPRERINKEVNFVRLPDQQQPSQSQNSVNGQNSNGYSSQQDSAKSTPQRTINNLKSPPTPSKESNWGWATLMRYLKSDAGNGPGGLNDGEIGQIGPELISPEGNSSPGGSSTPDDIASEIPNDLEYRMDYVLKESNFTSTYLAALTSHTSYWSSPDTAFFVLAHLYGDLLDVSQNPTSSSTQN